MLYDSTQNNETIDFSTFLTQKEVAKLLRITVQTVIKHRDLGKLKYAQIGEDGKRKKPIYPKAQFTEAEFFNTPTPQKL